MSFDDRTAHALETWTLAAEFAEQRALGSDDDPLAEALRERDWWELETLMREFASKYGWGAVNRAVSNAMAGQGELHL